jgi:hypothetical protein
MAAARTTLLASILVFVLVALAPSAGAQGTVDGEVTAGEYAMSVSLGDGHFKLYWEIVNDTIKIAMVAEASGIVAIGIEPTKRMKDADMIIGWRVDTGGFEVHDAWSVDETGPHPDDTAEGGTFDLLEYTAKESGGVTTVEFTRNLTTGDKYDKDFPKEGKVKIIWATSDDDDFSAYHGRRGTAIIDIDTGDVEAVEYPVLWPWHALFMGLATIFFVITWFTVVHKKRLKKKYVDIHHSVGFLGVLFAIIGLGIGFYMVADLDQGHFRIVHAFLGGTDIALGLVVITLGQIFLAKAKMKRKVRRPHIYLGGAAIILMAITALAGLIYVFP